MNNYTSDADRQRASVEDILLAVLGFVGGPLLWWMGQVWNDNQAASSMQTLEYWIALVCGFLGVLLCVLWLIFMVAGMAFVIAIKTHNKLIAYWSELFTPRFLRRLLISVFGAQLAFTSQAVAATAPQHEPDEISTAEFPVPFMPSVVDKPVGAEDEAGLMLDDAVTVDKHSTPDSNPGAAVTPTPERSQSPAELAPEPRQHSETVVKPAPEAVGTHPPDLKPTPRQSSVVEVAPQPLQQEPTPQSDDGARTDAFTPQQPIPSPDISLHDRSSAADDPTFVVKRGDCLWDIAHHELGADASLFQIDQRWRQWWEHNRTTIGDDPHTIKPGTVLFAPPFSQ